MKIKKKNQNTSFSFLKYLSSNKNIIIYHYCTDKRY